MSVAALPLRKRLPVAQGNLTRLAPENLTPVQCHRLTNPLYRSRGMKANSLIWYWQNARPSRIREWVTLTADDVRLQIAFDGEVIGLGTEPRDWHRYAGDVRLLAWTAYHEPILELLRVVFQREWLPESLGDCDASAQADDVQAGFSIYADSGECVGNGLASFDRRFVPTLSMRSDWREPRPCTLAYVRSMLGISIDEFDVPAAELSALQPGSVVRLDNRTLRATPRVVVPVGTLQAIAEIRGTQVTILGFAAASSPTNDSTPGATPMSDIDTPSTVHPKDSPAFDGAIDPSCLPVKLRFTVGRTSVPFGVLADIAPGFVFELDKPLDDQVITIHANDTPIAYGELVTLGDLLGVRISRMLPQP